MTLPADSRTVWLEGEIHFLNQSMDISRFNCLLEELDVLIARTSFQEVEGWLLGLLVTQHMPFINGVLALLYYSADCTQVAEDYALRAKPYFPDNKFWNNFWSAIIQGAIVKNFDDEYAATHADADQKTKWN